MEDVTTYGSGGDETAQPRPERRRSSAGHVEYCVRMQVAAIEDGDGVFCGKNYQLDFPELRVLLHFRHHRQPAFRSGTDNKPTALPRDIFIDRYGRVAVGVAIPLGSLLLALSNLAPVNDQVVVIDHAVDLDRAERELLDMHRHHLPPHITP